VRTSVGRTGVCWDNAAAEAFFAALKNEMYYRPTWPTRARATIRRRRIHRGVVTICG
jgi:transposase InsO family protein